LNCACPLKRLITSYKYTCNYYFRRFRSLSFYLLILEGNTGKILSVAEIQLLLSIWVLKAIFNASCSFTKSVYLLQIIQLCLDPSRVWMQIWYSMKSPFSELIQFLNWTLKEGLLSYLCVRVILTTPSSNEFLAY